MIVNIIIIIFILISIVAGYKKGFTDTIVRLVGGLIAIFIAYLLMGGVSSYISENTGIDKKLSDELKTNITNMVKNDEEALSEPVKNEQNLFLKSKLISGKYNEIKNSIEVERTIKINNLADSITRFIIKGISFITIFFVVSILIIIIRLILGGITDLPILKEIDAIAGFVIGLLIAIIQLFIIFAIISVLSPMSFMNGINRIVDGSSIAKFISNNNILLIIISNKLF